MENALAVENLSQLKRLFSGRFKRVYFGAETCERKIPSKQQLAKARGFCEKKKVAFSLLTPFSTDVGLRKLQQLFALLSSEDEIIANDFGVLTKASECKAVVVAGRLLNKQFRDPRIASFNSSSADELLGHLSLSQASVPNFRKLLSSFGVKRLELDNLLQGIGTNLSGTGMSASLYFPFVFVSATRMCVSANCSQISQFKKVGIFPCNMDCLRFRFRLSSSSMPAKLLLVGNALFFQNKKLPANSLLAAKGIDRLVTNTGLMQLE